MNELLTHTRHALQTALLVLTLSQASAALGQNTGAVRSADFIVAVVNSEPVTNSEVMAVRNRLLRSTSRRWTCSSTKRHSCSWPRNKASGSTTTRLTKPKRTSPPATSSAGRRFSSGWPRKA
jgi:hypothetical protein